MTKSISNANKEISRAKAKAKLKIAPRDLSRSGIWRIVDGCTKLLKLDNRTVANRETLFCKLLSVPGFYTQKEAYQRNIVANDSFDNLLKMVNLLKYKRISFGMSAMGILVGSIIGENLDLDLLSNCRKIDKRTLLKRLNNRRMFNLSGNPRQPTRSNRK